MVPNGWKRVPLETVAEVRSGVAKGKSGLKDPIAVPYLRVANVQDGHINLDEVKEIEIERTKLERYSLKFGDVLMNEGGDFDKLGRGDVWLGQISPCLHQNHVFAVRPNQETLDSFFLAALAASNYGKTYFLSCAKRSTNLASINSKQIKEFPVLVPPLPEQKKIAQLLSTWDKAITTTEHLIANSRQQKKALMQQLLTGKQRLLSDTSERFSGEWKEGKLSDLCTINPKKQGSPIDEKVSFIPMDAVSEEAKIIRQEERGYTEVEKGFTSFRDNDVLIAKITPCFENGKGGYAENLKNGIGFGSTEFHVLRAKDNVCSRFIYYVTNTKNFRVRGEINMQGSAGQKRVTKDYLSLYSIKYPPSLEEQQKITTVLSAADKELEILQQKLSALKQEKKALMQQLLTGKRRVSVEHNAA
ncbi:hypothetical protein GCM10011502_08810 [Oceanisphaera marina]|uniref:Type I restriction modification DNA specificity domain-containing protein n=1 Tax=Oceanisphaera marina TaxID=2017550 RepID=A0ABQ1IF98_9GAMM|nr:restriction endonuclease subunit S [Oceanisphaera marina]GGB37823.1 hypothetical protein GCM10011502_08810 [Oceanisphaera marina]